MRAYRALLRRYGPQGWWPARTPFEVIVGAILTQNTAWTNVERAIANLRRARAISPKALLGMPRRRLARLIRPAGYFNLKSMRLRRFLGWFRARHGASIARMRRIPVQTLREGLLEAYGVGPETADSIVLYACGLPSFVSDAYTRRVAVRHGWASREAGYEEVRGFFVRGIPRSAPLYNEYHALLVAVGKERCRPSAPRCGGCPLERFLPGRGPRPL